MCNCELDDCELGDFSDGVIRDEFAYRFNAELEHIIFCIRMNRKEEAYELMTRFLEGVTGRML